MKAQLMHCLLESACGSSDYSLVEPPLINSIIAVKCLFSHAMQYPSGGMSFKPSTVCFSNTAIPWANRGCQASRSPTRGAPAVPSTWHKAQLFDHSCALRASSAFGRAVGGAFELAGEAAVALALESSATGSLHPAMQVSRHKNGKVL